MTLADLRAAFDADRATLQLAASDPNLIPPNTCRYCGLAWWHWAGSKLDGHAQCVVSAEFKRAVLELKTSGLEDGTLVTYKQIAGALDVSIAIVRAWVAPIAARNT
jgi:hypothetical protein